MTTENFNESQFNSDQFNSDQPAPRDREAADTLLTAHALGQLEGDEQAVVERLLADPGRHEERRTVDEIGPCRFVAGGSAGDGDGGARASLGVTAASGSRDRPASVGTPNGRRRDHSPGAGGPRSVSPGAVGWKAIQCEGGSGERAVGVGKKTSHGAGRQVERSIGGCEGDCNACRAGADDGSQ